MTRFPAPPLRHNVSRRALIGVAVLLLAMTALRLIYAGNFELRTDEAYYWTWSKESVLSFLDHPPLIAWLIRAGTAIFGDTAFGVRFFGVMAMTVTQLLLVDIVRRLTQDLRAMVLAALMTEAALYYGLLMAKIAPDVAMIPFAVAMLWALVRLDESDDGRWWLLAGLCGGLALLAKFTVVMFVPGILAFMLVRPRWLASPYPWLAVVIALLLFSPVLIWNAQHDFASVKFQFIRATTNNEVSLRTLGDYLGLQFGQVGFILFPLLVSASVTACLRGLRRRDPVLLLLSVCVLVPFLYFGWKSLTLRVGDTWPMFIWPPAIALAAINLVQLRDDGWSEKMVRAARRWTVAAIATGMPLVVLVFLYCVVAPWNLIGKNDPLGGEGGYDGLAARALQEMQASGATWIATTNYRTYAMLRWHLKDRVPVVQVNERARFIGFRDPGMAAIRGKPGIYVAETSDDHRAMLLDAGATLKPLTETDTIWRGTAMKHYRIDALTGWTPELNPQPDTPFYRPPALA